MSSLAWTPGEYGNPTAIKSFRVADLNLGAEQAIPIDNNNYMGEYQPGPARDGGRWIDLSFTAELRGSNVADVPPPEMSLLRACAFEEDSSGSTPAIVYSYELKDPHLATDTPAGDLEAIDLVHNVDRLVRTAKSCVGNVVLNFTAGQMPTLAFTMRGNLASAADGGTEADIDAYATYSLPVPVETSALTITPLAGEAYTPVIKSLIYDCGNIIDPRVDMNGEQGFSAPMITGRKPSIVAIVETDLIANVNWEQLYTAQTPLAFSLTHNAGGGIREEVVITFSGLLNAFPQITDVNGMACYILTMDQWAPTSTFALKLAWAAS
jgi:hypothetical protein